MYAIYADQLGWFLGLKRAAYIWQSHELFGISFVGILDFVPLGAHHGTAKVWITEVVQSVSAFLLAPTSECSCDSPGLQHRIPRFSSMGQTFDSCEPAHSISQARTLHTELLQRKGASGETRAIMKHHDGRRPLRTDRATRSGLS